MHRYMLGIVLVQILTALLVWLGLAGSGEFEWLRVVLPCLCLAVTAGFWFQSLGRQTALSEIARIKDSHAKEREGIQVSAERAKQKVLRDAHKQITREVGRARSSANIKAGTLFVAMAGLGSLLMFTQFMTLGLVAMSTAGGALGGYLLRARRERAALPQSEKQVPIEPRRSLSRVVRRRA